MYIQIDRQGSVDGLQSALSGAIDGGAKGILILASEGNDFRKEDVDLILSNLPVPVFGGVFPGIIYGRDILERGTIVAGLSTTPRIQIVENLSSDVPDFDDVLDDTLIRGWGAKTMFVIVDGMATRNNTLVASLFNVFGLEVNYIGGGAGPHTMIQRPCLFTNRGLIEDGAILAVVDKACGVGVSHGMTSVSGPYRITESRDNVIYSLNWKPPFGYIKEIIRGLGEDIGDGKTYPVAGSYCLGSNRLGTQKIVRDPVRVGDNDSLIFVAEVGEEEFADIIKATPESTVDSARVSLSIAKDMYRGEKPYKTAICFVCYGCQVYLGSLGPKQIEAIQEVSEPVIGVLSMGEIANSGKDYLDLLSRTSVVGLFED